MGKDSSKRIKLYAALVILVCQFGPGQGKTNAGQDPQPLAVSKGVYRLPFADGIAVTFVNNHTNHPASLHRIDMTGAGSLTPVVSSAAGWIRLIVENNDTKCPNFTNDGNGDGVVTTNENNTAQNNACGNYSGPSTFCCEKDFEANGGNCPGAGTCLNGPNNLVWMQHPNGEWTKYTHMLFGSIGTGTDINGNPGAGHVVDDYVAAGTVLGVEGDVGFAGGVHVHFEVAVPDFVITTIPNNTEDDPDSPLADKSDWFTSTGFLVGDGIQDDVVFEDKDGDGFNDPDDDVNRQNRIAVFCQVGIPVISDVNTAGPCDDLCNSNNFIIQGTFTPNNTPRYEQAANTIGNGGNDFVIKAYAGVAIRAGSSITLTPGFHAEPNANFSASIGSCDSPGGTGK